MKKLGSEDPVNYTLGVTGASTVVALFKSIIRSKTLAIMFALGLIAAFSFLSFLFQFERESAGIGLLSMT